jgi:hypothetical protein
MRVSPRIHANSPHYKDLSANLLASVSRLACMAHKRQTEVVNPSNRKMLLNSFNVLVTHRRSLLKQLTLESIRLEIRTD